MKKEQGFFLLILSILSILFEYPYFMRIKMAESCEKGLAAFFKLRIKLSRAQCRRLASSSLQGLPCIKD